MAQWLNTEQPLDLPALRGRVVFAAAFQMLCPGCVEQTIPQLKRAHTYFPAAEVAVIGLHTVFEHHEAMGPGALAAFLHEYKVSLPVGIDAAGPSGDPIPCTMRRYGMPGTPTLLLIDRAGRLRRQTFGHVPDLQLGAEVMAFMREAAPIAGSAKETAALESVPCCDEQGCRSEP
jgi:hypothetical protein